MSAPITSVDSINLSELYAIIGLKIEMSDVTLATFPQSPYDRGARDAMVNLLQAIRKAVEKNKKQK